MVFNNFPTRSDAPLIYGGFDILTGSFVVFSSGFRDSCFDKFLGISIVNKFFEDCIIFFLHFFRRANFIRSVPEWSYNILFVSLMMVRLEIKVPSRISGFSIYSKSKGGVVLLLMSISRKGISWSCSFSLVNWIFLFIELMKRKNSCWRLFGRAVKQSSTHLSHNKLVQGGLMKKCCSIFYMVSSHRTTEIGEPIGRPDFNLYS